jgi:outer membrane protein
MKKPQIIAIAVALAATGILYSLPKVIVGDDKQQIAGKTESSGKDATAGQTHTQALDPAQEQRAKNLTNRYAAVTDKEKKRIFADSLAELYRSAMLFDSVALYRQVAVGLKTDVKTLMNAGDACYDAFFFATDQVKVRQFGEKARAYYQQVLDLDAKQLDAKAKMAMTYVNSESPMQAVLLLREVIAADPKNEQAQFNLGLLSIKSGQYDKAQARFEEILKNNPANLQAKLYLGISYAEQNDKENARRLLQEAKAATQDVMVQNAADEYLDKIK